MSATAQNTRIYRNQSPFAAALKRVWPRHTAKNAALVARASVRTAQAWLADRATPSLPTLLAMAERDDNLRAELVRLVMETADVGTLGQMVGAETRRDAASQGDTVPGQGPLPDEARGLVARARGTEVKP